ncbi:mitotic checkpoint serine/threonine-protein kinase BUB1-like [Rhopalosiphum maidis]|uniref:mitotic checkpoint serine/threonine-protein kinase BUB1-like n=1 Tax=Rhopalosiphum maidis TaxID=43146 RepID=UPI000F00BA53|nr:mitotic checkpoint serine/threonine-protein kinase BUB1-like [Rhopalosiphum maidis]
MITDTEILSVTEKTMNTVDTSDALDLTKENIRPLRQGRKPIQLETALQAQSNMEIQQKLNKEKEKYEHAIRTYEGDDPLAPHFEYMKWLEQIYLKHGPESNLMPLIEETVQKFKDDSKYKQDPRFITILINFIENQSNAVELYQTVYNQGIGTMCALFYRAWAELLDRYNDFKRVDQIFLLGIKAKAEPVEELEQAHLQFQLSVARRMLNGQITNDDDKNQEPEKRHAFNVLKKSETHSGVRHGFGGVIGKVPQMNNVNGKNTVLRIFEDNDEKGLLGIATNNCDLAQKGLNKENTVKAGPWTKPKKTRSKILKPVSTIDFEVHQDNNLECVTKLPGITVPNALRSIKGNTNLSCPVAVFEPPDPTKRPMYCKEKVYAAGRDVQLEEIRYEIYLKQEKEKQLKEKSHSLSLTKSQPKEKIVKPLKKVILSEDNNEFKVPLPLRNNEPDSLSQSVTVNTRVAIDLVQQMWNSPCADKEEESELISRDRKPIAFDAFEEVDNNIKSCPSDFMVYEDNKTPIDNKVFNIQEKEVVRNQRDFYVYTDDNDQGTIHKEPTVFVDCNDENQVYIDKNDENNGKSFKVPDVYVDNDENVFRKKSSKINQLMGQKGSSSIKNGSKIEAKIPQNQVKNPSDFYVYTDDDDQIIHKEHVLIDQNDKNHVENEIQVYIDKNDDNNGNDFKVPDVYVDNDENVFSKKSSKVNQFMGQKASSSIKNGSKIELKNDKNYKQPCVQNYQVYEDDSYETNNTEKQVDKTKDNSINPSNEGKSPIKKIQNIEVNDDDITCSTKAFAFLLSSSTPLAPGKTKTNFVIENQQQPQTQIEPNKNKETEEFQLGKNLSMILEASKERNSSTSSGIISSSVTKAEQQSSIDFGDAINPFDDELITKLLQRVIKFPNEHHKSGYVEQESELPFMRSEFKLGQNKMTLLNEIGKGSYARVMKVRLDGENAVERALKIQKPACAWEWYISKEIKHRLKDSEKALSYFINMDQMFVFKNGSIISMEFATHGTLLSVILAYKVAMNRSIPITVGALLILQVTSALKYLHQCQIIHGDLKPDNVIIKTLPNQCDQPCVQLIDFGRSIDMTLFPPDTTFTHTVKTADFICHEMREKLPWTYQTDYFGLAGIIYMVLMSDYMKTQKIRKLWVPLKPFPRYIDKELWGTMLSMLLNIESCKKLPNLDEIIRKLNKYLSIQQKVVLKHNFTSLKNALKKN